MKIDFCVNMCKYVVIYVYTCRFKIDTKVNKNINQISFTLDNGVNI